MSEVRRLTERLAAARRGGRDEEAEAALSELDAACARRAANPSDSDLRRLTEGLQLTMPRHPDPVEDLGIAGIGEIADRLGVHPRTVKHWRSRKVMPPADTRVSGQPVWRWERIAAWWERYRHRSRAGRSRSGQAPGKSRGTHS